MRDSISKKIRNANVISNSPLSPQHEACKSLLVEFESVGSNRRGNEVISLKSSSPFVKYSMRVIDKGSMKTGGTTRSIATGKAEAEIDTSAEDAAAWIYDYCSRDRMRINFEEGNLPRIVTMLGANAQITGTVKHASWPLRNRTFVTKMEWIKLTDSQVAIFVIPVDDIVDYGVSTSNCVKATSVAYCLLDKALENSCRITYYHKVDFRGVVPVSFINAKIPAVALRVIHTLRDVLSRDEDLDDKRRKVMVDIMKNEHQEYEESESQI